MAGTRNGNSGWDANPSHWNVETEIGVWDPSTANTTGGTTDWAAPSTANTTSGTADWGALITANTTSGTTDWTAVGPTDRSSMHGMYNNSNQQVQHYQHNDALYGQGEGFGTWQSDTVNRQSNPPYHPAQPIYRHPHSNDREAPAAANRHPTPATGQSGYMNNFQQNTNYSPPTSYEYYDPNASAPYYDNSARPSFPSSQTPESMRANRMPQNNVDSWRSPSTLGHGDVQNTVTNRHYREVEDTNQYTNPGTFRNPLMNETSEKPEILIERLRLQEETTKKQLLNSSRSPAVISKGALAMLGQQLNDAAVAFQSAENLKMARDAQLGILDDVGQDVIISKLSVNAVEFVPRKVPEQVPDPIPQQATELDESLLIESLGDFIENVLLQPGLFDELASLLVALIKSHLHSDQTVKKMVDMIFEKAINEDNFKYLGAKLCDKLTQPNVLNNFRTIFLKHFQGKYKEIQGLIGKRDDSNRKTIHGFFMFMAEVFIHIKINGVPIKALGRSLSKSLEELLADAPVCDVQFVCKVLKLAGSRLLDAFAESQDDLKNYEKNFEALTKYAEKVQSNQDEQYRRVILLIKSVSTLKDTNWGRTRSTTRPKSSIEDPEQYGEDLSLVDQNYYMNEPVFFTPEGVQYTAAEAQIPDFYEQHLAKHNISRYIPTEEGDSYSWSNAEEDTNDFIPSDEEFELYKEEDQEYTREFEKFLAESGQLK